MAKKPEIKDGITYKILDIKTEGEKTIVSCEFKRGRQRWRKAFLIRYVEPISLERFEYFLSKQNLEPTLSEEKRIGELKKAIGQERNVPEPEQLDTDRP